ncbi:MAG TPA: MFS transporter [Xanthobacteraceae bacterium]|nr:MFS transporter [Xanthobacteraceae bacterium]
MAYFRNNTVNLLNLHYGIHALALSGGGAFFAIYLLKSGVPVPVVVAAVSVILLGRFLIRPSVLVLARRVGLRPLVIAGTIASAAQYLLLAEVHSVGTALLVLIIVAAIADTYYWTSYHAYFAMLGDAEHRGHQVGAREAIAAVVGIVGPLATGWALTVFGPRAAFGGNALVLLLAALPIVWTPNVKIAWKAPGVFRAALPGVLLFAADGWMIAGYWFVWSIALFLALGESFSAFGGALALAAVVGAISGLVLGRLIDAGHGSRAAAVALAALVATITLRAASYGDAALAVIANAFGALIVCLYVPTLGTAIYNQAKRSPCALRFHIAAEGGWDLGGASAGLISAVLLWLGAPLGACILLSLLGALAVYILLRRYYAANATAVAPAAEPMVMSELAGSRREA